MKLDKTPLQSYHFVWLSAHPERTEEWLRAMLIDGFHVHHIDGDHFNDDPLNLVLIERGDHMMLHNGKKRLIIMPRVLAPKAPKVSRNTGRKSLKQLRKEIALNNVA